MYKVNSSNLIEAEYTPSGTLFFTYKKSNKESDEVSFDRYSSYLDKYDSLSGLLFYKTPNDYFYLLRSNSSKIKAKGKGEIDTNATFYPLIRKKELTSQILNDTIDEFWVETIEKKLKYIDQSMVYSENLIGKLNNARTKVSDKFLLDFNKYMDIIENPQSSKEIVIASKSKISELVKLNLKILDNYHKIENLTNEINLIQSHF